jgi:hypothetical protein
MANYSKLWQIMANYGKLGGSAMVCHSLLKFAKVCLGKFQQTLAKYGKL